MVSNQFPYLDCKYGGTTHTIWLPCSSRLERAPYQPGKPINQYSEIYVCPACGHVYEYRARNVLYRQPGRQEPSNLSEMYAAVLTFRCGVDNCESPVLIRKSTKDTGAANALVEEAKSWKLVSIRCPEGHAVTQIPLDAVARTDRQLGLI
jgi:hypothetical protein